MNNTEKYYKWLEMAKEDLETATIMFNNDKFIYVAFMCEQAVEKLAKGIYVYTFDKEAPFTHNINIVLKDIDKVTSAEIYTNKYELLFSKLTSFYIIARYDVYKQKIAKGLDKINAEELLNMSKEAFLWLKSLQE